MELYIGGFAQGKLEYVKRRYNENQKTEKLFGKNSIRKSGNCTMINMKISYYVFLILPHG